MKKATKKKKNKARRLKPVPRKRDGKLAKHGMGLGPRRRHFVHDGLRLHYWEWGDPKEGTYVFVHGIRDQGRSWESFIEAMIARGLPIKHAVALDLRGHGDSEWPTTVGVTNMRISSLIWRVC